MGGDRRREGVWRSHDSVANQLVSTNESSA
jgi:hypothetical protein